ncbi:MAG: ATP-binding protein, partial [Anaerolineae bacterium]|nr:ATP-binding protein [Anaerolineae bacterium]
VREAMSNLLGNAVKYTPEGGRINVTSYREDQRVYFIVEDTGIGIPLENLPRLFTSFYRVRQPGSEDIEGRGLGLSLVKTIIERHNGEVWVESSPGVGSRFGFWLPL